MLIKRAIIPSILPFLKRPEWISITGPRRCGKTVLLSMLKEEVNSIKKTGPREVEIITFEDRRALSGFTADPVLFMKSYADAGTKYLFIDEFQYAKNGGRNLKLAYDTTEGMKVVITGSSSLDIRAETGKYMTGRMVNFSLYPFSFGEYLNSAGQRLEQIHSENSGRLGDFINGRKIPHVKQGKDIFYSEIYPHFEKHLIWGGYPSVSLEKKAEIRKKLLDSIVDGYILKDIKGLLNLASDDALMFLARYLAAQCCGILNYNEAAKETGLDYRKLKKYIRILSETFVCREARPFFKNRKKELIKNPKIYFIDNGFKNSLCENYTLPDARQDKGGLVENAVFRRLLEISSDRPVNFWRTKAGAEVDFIYHSDAGPVPIEVKFSYFDSPSVTKSFMSFVEEFKPARGVILTRDFHGMIKKQKSEILFMPVYFL